MKWLLLKIFENDSSLEDAARKIGLDLQVINYGELYDPAADFSGCGLLHATIDAAKYLTKQFNVSNLLAWDAMRCQHYYTYWTPIKGSHGNSIMFNDRFNLLPIKELLRRWNQHADENGNLFVRPDSNDKIFNGRVYTQEDLALFIDGDVVKDHTLVLSAPAYKMEKEYRAVMHNGKFLTGSLYKEDGIVRLEHTNEIREFANSIGMFPGCPPVYVLDITSVGKEFFVLEIGSVNLAGLYACDPEPIVSAIAMETESFNNTQRLLEQLESEETRESGEESSATDA